MLIFISRFRGLGFGSGKHVDIFMSLSILDSRLAHMLTFYQFPLCFGFESGEHADFLLFFHDLGSESGEHVDCLISFYILDSRVVHMLTFHQCFFYFGFCSGQHVDNIVSLGHVFGTRKW